MTRDRDFDTRCSICGWPLSISASDGCTRQNCSQRPWPRRYFDPERAKREYGDRLPVEADPYTESPEGKAAAEIARLTDALTAAHAARDTAEERARALQWSHDAASLVALHGGIEGIDETMRERAAADPLVAAVLAAVGELEDDLTRASARQETARAAAQAKADALRDEIRRVEERLTASHITQERTHAMSGRWMRRSDYAHERLRAAEARLASAAAATWSQAQLIAWDIAHPQTPDGGVGPEWYQGADAVHEALVEAAKAAGAPDMADDEKGPTQ